jgi:two-component system chemotaxis sensor kinase CheA
MQSSSQPGKYRTIVLSIALFLVFDLGVLILNFYVASTIAQDAVGVNLAGRQRMLSQRMVKALLETQLAVQAGDEAGKSLGELKEAYALFDGTLHAFSEGGQATGGGGQPVWIDPVTDPDSTAAIAQAYAVWQPYREKLLAVLDTADPDRLGGALSAAVAHARAQNLSLLGFMNTLTTALEKVASAKAGRLRLIQTAGISLALINFMIILLHFIRRLRASDALAEAARRETQDILDSVSEGLFLLDRDGRIGQAHSRSLETILQNEDLAHRDFLDVLRPRVKDKVLKDAADYLDILFRDHVNLRLVESINPLDQVQLAFGEGEAHKHLAFQFARVCDKDRALSHLLVTVRDITQQITLQRELEQTRQQAEEQMSMLLGILHIDPPTLRDFLDRTERELKRINATLKEYGEHRHLFPKQYRLALLDIAPIVHGLKGDAALLELSLIEEKLHGFEDLIDELRHASAVNGEHLLSLTVRLDKIMTDVQSVREIIERVAEFRQAFTATPAQGGARPAVEEAPSREEPEEPAIAAAEALEPVAALAQAGEPVAVAPVAAYGTRNEAARAADGDDFLAVQLQQLAAKTADAEAKKVKLVVSGFDTLLLSGEQKAMLRVVLTQMVRNAIVHGIETPAERINYGKGEVGLIRVMAQVTAQGCRIICYDDGRGISAEQLREAAVRSGRWSEEELAGWDEERLRGLLFESGFSTARRVSVRAGRGVGMNVIRQTIAALSGQLGLSTQPGRFCAWSIQLPLVAALEGLEFQTV